MTKYLNSEFQYWQNPSETSLFDAGCGEKWASHVTRG